MISSSKFLQKIWNINYEISKEDKESDKALETKFNFEISSIIEKIDTSINEFKFNVSIALFYETYKIINKYLQSQISNFCISENTKKIMRCMIPFVPHLANECLELLQCSNKYEWPEVKKSDNNTIKFAVQINGKTKILLL